MIFTIPNLLSLLRIPFALVFLQGNPLYRSLAIIFAMITDILDGYLARRYRMSSQIGALIDPIMDKFFVLFVLATLITENRLSWPDALSLICRDYSVVLFGFYLVLSGQLTKYQFRAIWCGKVTTALQFAILLGLTFHYEFSPLVYDTFIVLGILALLELYFKKSDALLE